MTLPYMKSISLKDIEQVKLMNRIDTKYCFHARRLNEILKRISRFYYILEIEQKQILSYSTTYFDTSLNSMYKAHHNGHLNRYKIRHRTYVDSGISFLEIKRKNNKGRTIKNRIPTNTEINAFDHDAQLFLSNNCPFTTNDLHPAIRNQFHRITLVSKSFDERCTIDFNINFQNKDQEISLDHLAIIEVKTDGSRANSALKSLLSSMGIKKTGFSKYCFGRALTDDNLKHNAFKPKIRRLTKTLTINN
ncbi:polyphosphate polymerase domain-containing protein [Carboxylicivirga sp. RSCT41]|uniref:polyphosphate polymerase domain-containing protein n=1 Tax=Carboxylicivirga agarovorans TaxID=3417570 RepID=UPI003D3440CB